MNKININNTNINTFSSDYGVYARNSLEAINEEDEDDDTWIGGVSQINLDDEAAFDEDKDDETSVQSGFNSLLENKKSQGKKKTRGKKS